MKVTNIVYFTYLPRSPRCSDRHQICSGADLQDVINCAKFHSNPFRGFDFVGGSNFGLSHRNEVSPLTQGLNYRSASDDDDDDNNNNTNNIIIKDNNNNNTTKKAFL